MVRRSLLLLIVTVMCSAGMRLAVAADDLVEVARLRREGQVTAALTRADVFLGTQPKDAQMRFLRALLLVDLKRTTEAVRALESLTEEYPDLAEPYNNLAALYASVGDYGKARSALEEALRLRPAYATAHENLGDVYAALAARSYANALTLDPTLPAVKDKLTQIRQVTAAASASAAATISASAPAPR